MHKPVFIFKKFYLGGGGGHEYEHYFAQVNWLSNNQKPFAVIAVETVKTDFIHKYVPEEAIIHNYMPEEAMKSWVW